MISRSNDKQDELHSILSDTNREIIENDYHIQVEKAENSAHLFFNMEGRKPVMRQGDGFTVGDQVFSREELIERIEKEPHRFSPDVITRPLLQSYLFPVLSQKAGPSEIAYLAQLSGIFDVFDMNPPFYMARPSATVVEKRFAELMHHNHIEFSQLTGDIEQIINHVLAHTFPGSIEKGFAILCEDIEYHFDKFTIETFGLNSILEQYSRQTFGRIEFALKNFERKAFTLHKKTSTESRERIYRLYNALYTERGLQERSLNVSYFLSKYGRGFVTFLYENLESEEKAHQLLDLR